LTEVAQLAGDFNTSSNYVASGLPKFRTIEEADFVIHPRSRVDITTLPDLSHDNIKVEVENCVSSLSQIGMEVIVVDVTHTALQIPAFYTIIPGAHFRERATGTSVAMFSAKLMAESGDPAWAISELKKVDALMPAKYYVKFFLGSCYLSTNELSRALICLEEALSLGPNEEDIPSIYSYMGICLKDLGQYREAIRVLEKAEDHDDERTDIYNLMGFCHFKLKEHQRAIGCFQKLLRLDPSSAIDYANIASNYRDMGDKEQAIRYYRFALELDPTIEFARDNLHRLGQG
jgi:ribosomal protein S12 methylthiotransferase accessory factor